MSNGEIANINITSGKIGGDLNMHEIRITGQLQMDTTAVGSHLLIRNAQIANAALFGSKIDGNIQGEKLQITGALNMDTATVGGHLLMRNAQLSYVDRSDVSRVWNL